jgi:hypothetical protein
MSDIVTRLRTVKVPESRHVGFIYETWAGEAADEIERLRSALAAVKQATGAAALKKFFLCQDDDGHWYLVDNAIRDQWFAWLDIPGDDERSWKVPAGAERLDGAPNMIVFTNPNDAREI